MFIFQLRSPTIQQTLALLLTATAPAPFPSPKDSSLLSKTITPFTKTLRSLLSYPQIFLGFASSRIRLFVLRMQLVLHEQWRDTIFYKIEKPFRTESASFDIRVHFLATSSGAQWHLSNSFSHIKPSMVMFSNHFFPPMRVMLLVFFFLDLKCSSILVCCSISVVILGFLFFSRSVSKLNPT